MKTGTEKEIIRTIYHKNVSDFFKSMGLFKKLTKGEIRCDICGEILTFDNFRAVAKKSGKLLFCCDKESCIQNLSSHIRNNES